MRQAMDWSNTKATTKSEGFMSRYLLTIKSDASLASLRDVTPPADYLVESAARQASGPGDGLDHWELDLQLAGSLSDWAKDPAYAALWSYLRQALASADVRPRASLSICSRFDPHSIRATIAYLGDHELKRAEESIRQRLAAAVVPKTNKIKEDLTLAF
jgi:hypothetical protein